MRNLSAFLCATGASIWVALILALTMGGLKPFSAALSLIAGVVLLFWMLMRPEPKTSPKPAPPGPWEWASILLFALCSARAFLWLVTVQADEIKVLSPNNLGDLSLHLTYIHYLARGVEFWPDNPIFADGKLTYPVGVDLFNTLLVLVGVDTFRGLIWVGLVGALLTGLALWRWGRGVALIAFLGNGGLAAFIAIFQDRGLSDFQSTLAWKSIFLSLFVTQRGLLFALPAGLLLLCSWRARYFDQEKSQQLPLWVEVLLYASMPLFHLHTFLFLSLLLAAWYLFVPAARRGLLQVVLTSLLPASFLVFLVTGAMKGASVIGWKPGWMWDDQSWIDWCAKYLSSAPPIASMLLFWPVNFGFALVAVGWLIWKVWKLPAAAWPRALALPALGIFLLCCFVKFAPWEWDNTKIMVWCYLALLPLAWDQLLASRPLAIRAIAVVLLFGSGVASVIGGIDTRFQGYAIATRSELDGVFKAVAPIPVGEAFAAYPTYNHPLLLAGRKVTLGYIGHAWSHGLPYRSTELHLTALMNGEETWRQDAAALKVRYLFWGREEAEHYSDSSKPWLSVAEPIASGSWGAIYDLQPAL